MIFLGLDEDDNGEDFRDDIDIAAASDEEDYDPDEDDDEPEDCGHFGVPKKGCNCDCDLYEDCLLERKKRRERSKAKRLQAEVEDGRQTTFTVQEAIERKCENCINSKLLKPKGNASVQARVCKVKKMKDGRPKKVKFFAAEKCEGFKEKTEAKELRSL